MLWCCCCSSGFCVGDACSPVADCEIHCGCKHNYKTDSSESATGAQAGPLRGESGAPGDGQKHLDVNAQTSLVILEMATLGRILMPLTLLQIVLKRKPNLSLYIYILAKCTMVDPRTAAAPQTAVS